MSEDRRFSHPGAGAVSSERVSRAERYAQRPHGWGGFEANYGVAASEVHPIERNMRGRGPKNYRRSDDRLRELICERLTADPHIDASEVTVEVRDGHISLEGTVADRWTKFAIEDVAAQCADEAQIDNRLRVRRTDQQPWAPSEWPIGS